MSPLSCNPHGFSPSSTMVTSFERGAPGRNNLSLVGLLSSFNHSPHRISFWAFSINSSLSSPPRRMYMVTPASLKIFLGLRTILLDDLQCFGKVGEVTRESDDLIGKVDEVWWLISVWRTWLRWRKGYDGIKQKGRGTSKTSQSISAARIERLQDPPAGWHARDC